MRLEEAGVPKRVAAALNRKKVYTADDLLRFVPRRYHDYRKLVSIR